MRVPKGDGPTPLPRADVNRKARTLIGAAWADPARFDGIARLLDRVEATPPDDLPQALGRLLRSPFAPSP